MDKYRMIEKLDSWKINHYMITSLHHLKDVTFYMNDDESHTIEFTEYGFGYLQELFKFSTNKPEYSYAQLTQMYRNLEVGVLADSTEYYEKAVNDIREMLYSLNEALQERIGILNCKQGVVVGTCRKNYSTFEFDRHFIEFLDSTIFRAFLKEFWSDDSSVYYLLSFSNGDLLRITNGFDGRVSLKVSSEFRFHEQDYSLNFNIRTKHLTPLKEVFENIAKTIHKIQKENLHDKLEQINGGAIGMIMLDMLDEEDVEGKVGKEKYYERVKEVAYNIYGSNGREALERINREYYKHGYKKIVKSYTDRILKKVFEDNIKRINN